MNPVMKNRLIGLAIALAIFVADQAMKWFVVGRLGMQLGDSIEVVPFFDLTLVHNYGVSLGMFTATSPEMRWGLVGLTGIIAVVVTIWMLRERLMGDIAALALILGGALGNIRDRYELGYVIDYADLHIGEFRPFLIFNVADAAITIGVLIILLRSFLSREKTVKGDSEPAPGAVET